MIEYIRKLIKSKDLLITWTNRIIQTRYQQSILGSLWILIQPISSVAVFTIIFTLFVPIDTGNTPYLVFSYAAMVPWNLFSSSLGDMTSSLIANMNLISKIYFPREILPLASLLARLIDFFVAYLILFILILVYKIQIYPVGLLFLPLILLIQIILTFGLGLGLSAMNVFYRDVSPVMGLILQIWFYASPIIYPFTLVPDQLKPYYFITPMAAIVESYRAILLNGTLPGPYLIVSAVIAIVIFALGYWFFKRVEFQFADII